LITTTSIMAHFYDAGTKSGRVHFISPWGRGLG
jgi:hypothetical protein